MRKDNLEIGFFFEIMRLFVRKGCLKTCTKFATFFSKKLSKKSRDTTKSDGSSRPLLKYGYSQNIY